MPHPSSRPRSWRLVTLLGAGLLLAIVAYGYARLSRPDASAPSPPDAGVAAEPTGTVAPGLREEIARLRRSLEAEREARSRLQREFDELSARVDTLDAGAEPEVASPPRSASRTGARARSGRRWIDRHLLETGGFSPSDAERLAYTYDSIEMDRLELENRATREGWRSSGRYARAHAEIEQRIALLRHDLEETEYDWLLFASGRPNRVVVRDVLGVSPAAEAGVEPGDLILRYAGERVFAHAELVKATTEGRAGELVRVEVERDGEARSIFLPRGPLGVQIGPRLVRPANAG